ncbi:helix-turn-helix domain-containing protein [Dyella sp. ASV21]|uniref:helix-turn-helix domain-containing protein n=1 Tax=Dyella sp. ASV21 TaxID=2795114 RepID=UPI0018EDBC42|nr:helix-turn-helix domain-containing protein [Dyella sp. ASV21]
MAMEYDARVLHRSNDITHDVISQHLASKDSTLRVESRLINASEIIQRMREVFGAKNDTALAAELNVTTSTPSNWRQRNSAPIAVCATIAATHGVSLDWLVFGEGAMYPKHDQDAAPTPESAHSTASAAAHRLSHFVYNWDRTRPPEEMVWLEQQFKRAVPEYVEWLSSPK